MIRLRSKKLNCDTGMFHVKPQSAQFHVKHRLMFAAQTEVTLHHHRIAFKLVAGPG